ncbi:hypothetical protein TSAR_015708 [Trichomalopsis sarcophagae]|uniref:CHHC U11-48K-type domain-containing protein n=1 Tax=Trichomalopsis sarcophagae TaxID=543379 RepID=A0A232ENB3_9HYME|nr:hypothetical protein TSAR_015708 [Trichomalopsis sarcophagae]
MAEDDQPLDVCPYNKSHHILRTRMPHHITKCSKNYPGIKLKHCPYDRRHRLHPEDYERHVQSCQAKEFTAQTTEIEENRNATFETPGILPVQPFVAWDTRVKVWVVDGESPSPLQSIQANSETRQFAAPLIGGSKKQRKEHRYLQRRLVQEQGEFNDPSQKENQNQKSIENYQTSSYEEQHIFDKLHEKPAIVQSGQNIASPSTKTETETLKISELYINNQKNDSAKQLNISSFNYAAALSAKNKQTRQTANLKTVTNWNHSLESERADTLARYSVAPTSKYEQTTQTTKTATKWNTSFESRAGNALGCCYAAAVNSKDKQTTEMRTAIKRNTLLESKAGNTSGFSSSPTSNYGQTIQTKTQTATKWNTPLESKAGDALGSYATLLSSKNKQNRHSNSLLKSKAGNTFDYSSALNSKNEHATKRNLTPYTNLNSLLKSKACDTTEGYSAKHSAKLNSKNERNAKATIKTHTNSNLSLKSKGDDEFVW